MSHIETIKKDILKAVAKASGEELDASVLEYPADAAKGDIALPCFALAKTLKKAPPAIAAELARTLSARKPKAVRDPVARIEAKGPYLNFFLDREKLLEAVLEGVSGQRSVVSGSRAKRVMVEYVSPNNNKPLHLGHIRCGLVGESVCGLLESQGHEAIRALLLNDRGLAIAKSMAAYRRWGNGVEPQEKGMKGDRFVGDLYVQFEKVAKEDPSLEEEAHELIRRWEAGDAETRALWKKIDAWAVAGQEESYKRLGFRFDVRYRESDIYQGGKDIVEEGLAKGVFVRDETGAVKAPLEDAGLPDKVVLRADGTSLYITQDLVLAKRKMEDHAPDLSVIVTANEQNLHFKQLFAILKKLDYEWAGRLVHLSYGYVTLPEGRMKSREGTVVEADDLLSALEADAAIEIKQRHAALGDDETVRRAHQLALGALKFHFLDVDIASDMVFNPKESLSFNGRTGPYLQYMHARVRSLLKKAEGADRSNAKRQTSNVTDAEHRLAMLLARYPETLDRAAASYRPSVLTGHLYDLAKAFAAFYESVPVLAAEAGVRGARLALAEAAGAALKDGLALLGIPAPEEM